MQDNKQPNPSSGMNVDVEHLSVTGHVVFAGRDGSVNVTTGGNVDQNSTQTILVGGIETTREALESMKIKLLQLQQTIENEQLDEESKDAALFDLKTVEDQLTSKNKPNSQILSKAAKALYRLSPALAAGVLSLFGEPLASQIIVGIGGTALQFLNRIINKPSST